MKPQRSSEQGFQCLRSQCSSQVQLQSPGPQPGPCSCPHIVPRMGTKPPSPLSSSYWSLHNISPHIEDLCLLSGCGESKTKVLILKSLGMWNFHDSRVPEGSKPGDRSLGPVFSCLHDPKVTLNSELSGIEMFLILRVSPEFSVPLPQK